MDPGALEPGEPSALRHPDPLGHKTLVLGELAEDEEGMRRLGARPLAPIPANVRVEGLKQGAPSRGGVRDEVCCAFLEL
eukprot:3290277-Lingulodinium_polyedra.AAC.1